MWTYETIKSLEGKGCGCPLQHLPVLDIMFYYLTYCILGCDVQQDLTVRWQDLWMSLTNFVNLTTN